MEFFQLKSATQQKFNNSTGVWYKKRIPRLRLRNGKKNFQYILQRLAGMIFLSLTDKK